MAIISAHKSDIGKRPHNEDYIWFDDQAGLYIVADGLGGQEAGDVASHLATSTIGPMVVNQVKSQSLSKDQIKELVTSAIETANKLVYEAAHQAGQKRKMGTTIVMALIQNSTAYISHAGDSRAYLIRESTLTQLTEDDSWAAEFGGTQSKDNARTKAIEHILTKSIGQSSQVDPSFKVLSLTPGDCLLLCTDGLWDQISEEQILTEFGKAGDNLTQAVDTLVAAANAIDGSDNISVIALKLVA